VSLIDKSLLMACLLAVVPAHAGLITNGGFETGDLSGWETIGGVSAAVTVSTFATPEPALAGQFSAEVVQGGGGIASPTELDAFFGLPSGSISAAPLTDPSTEFSGVGIRQTVDVVAGDVLSFLWNVTFLESGSIVDAAFFATSDSGGTIVELLDGIDAFANNAFGTTFAGSYSFGSTGVQTIGFGVIDGADSCCGGSTVLIDDVQFLLPTQPEPVPAPATLLLITGSLGLLLIVKRRR
jgi:hypothetical protein